MDDGVGEGEKVSGCMRRRLWGWRERARDIEEEKVVVVAAAAAARIRRISPSPVSVFS